MLAKRAASLAVYGLICASPALIPTASAAGFNARFEPARSFSGDVIPVAGRRRTLDQGDGYYQPYGSPYIGPQPYQCMTDDGYGRHRPCDSSFKRRRQK